MMSNIFAISWPLLARLFLLQFIRSVSGAVVTDHDMIVTCYISTWAVYREGTGSYTLDAFDPTLCTHAIYAFAGLDNQNDTILPLDEWQDLNENEGKGGYEKLINLRESNPHLKVLLAIGGWNEGSEAYSNLTADPERRQAFATNALHFIRRHGFDGLDLDWEYPTQRGGSPIDKENFVAFVQELNQAFKKYNLLLTSAFGASKDIIDSAYDMEALSKYLDFLHIMCYDYNGSWNRQIGPNAPLTSKDFLNVEYTIEHLLDLGAPSSKLVLGLPFYGRTFISPVARALMGDVADEVGFPGPFTKENGFMGYNEMCEELKRNPSDWTLSWDAAAGEMVATKSNDTVSQVVVFDNTRSIANKVRFAVRQKLAGLMVWSVDTDDFKGLCEPEMDTYVDFGDRDKMTLSIPRPVSGKYPLLKTISNAIVVATDELTQENIVPNETEHFEMESSLTDVSSTASAVCVSSIVFSAQLLKLIHLLYKV